MISIGCGGFVGTELFRPSCVGFGISAAMAGIETETAEAVEAADAAEEEDSLEVVAPLRVDDDDGGDVYLGGGSGFGGRVVLGGLGLAAVSIFAYRTDAVTQQEVVPLMGESVRPLESARIGV